MMIKKIRKFLRLPWKLKLLLSEAIITLFFSQLTLFLLPVGEILKKSSSRGTMNGPDYLNDLAAIKWALYNASRVCYRKNKCLVQCIAGKRMLARRGIESKIFMGVRHNDEKLIIAHAWLKAGDFEVVEKGEDYLELSKF